jgi:20S proteasome subunit alpha 4
MSGYDRALTLFSPNGQLFQVEYANEAVKQGTSIVGIKSSNGCQACLIIEKKQAQTLQDPRTIRKVLQIDEHIYLSFSGLQADARVIIDAARIECQQFRLNCEDAPSVIYVARYIAELMQSYTHKGGARPFGVSIVLVGKDQKGGDNYGVYQIEPSGVFNSYKAVGVGRQGKGLNEWLEKEYLKEETVTDSVDLGVRAMLQFCEWKNIEVWMFDENSNVRKLSPSEIEAISTKMEEEQAKKK